VLIELRNLSRNGNASFVMTWETTRTVIKRSGQWSKEAVMMNGLHRDLERLLEERKLRETELETTNRALAEANVRAVSIMEDLEETTLRLEIKNQELETFLYTLAHDLKTPLVSLQGMMAMLADSVRDRLDQEEQHYLERLQANTTYMGALILDLLEFFRVERVAHPPEAVAVAEVVNELLLEWAEPIRDRGAKVVCRDLPLLWGERTRIEQVFSNLIGNALKFLGADNPAPAIEIGAEDRGTAWECYVRDNGIGIDPAYHEKIFELFQRLREVEAEGTGVGLAILAKIVERAGGEIWIESKAGQGATFRFTWPKVVEERSENSHG
jgi:signal transduction histidine kinase